MNVSYEDIIDDSYKSYSWAHFVMQFFYNKGNMTKQNSFAYMINELNAKISRRFIMKKVTADFLFEESVKQYRVKQTRLFESNDIDCNN